MKHEHYSRKEITVYQNIANGGILCVSGYGENIQNYECCRKARNCLVLETIRLGSVTLLSTGFYVKASDAKIKEGNLTLKLKQCETLLLKHLN